MGKQKSQPVQISKKKNLFVGTINKNELIMNSKGKLNSGMNPELRTKIHKSVKDYDRNRAKRELSSQMKDFGY